MSRTETLSIQQIADLLLVVSKVKLTGQTKPRLYNNISQRSSKQV